ncbi:MAG: glycosyltransferase family 4 protein [Microscillaceae bacterium]|jgi:glycosyltransferase involved in cell wall biosynthesis|nr:glycosyltransferase family 4 protein [Microscillaceae bacterium]
MINVTYIISNIDKALAFEWIAEGLNADKFKLSFILLNPDNSYLEEYLKKQQIPVVRVTYRGKKDLFRAFWQVRKHLKQFKTQVVHCHLFEATLLGILAARSLGIRKRIFTRHHTTLHHQYFPRAVYYDRFCNYWATDIVAISQTARQILIEQEFVKPQKIQLIHHGFQLNSFFNPNSLLIRQLEEKYKTKGKFPILGIIARHTHWKGIQYTIPAFEKLLKDYPNAYLLLANAVGDYKPEIDKLLAKIPASNYIQITFETELAALYRLLDIYVHVPINETIEAFGQTYVEALASEVPSIFTLSGVAVEFIKDKENALVVPFENTEAIYEAMLTLLTDRELGNRLTQQGKESVQAMFSLEKMIQSLEKLYEIG